MRGPGASTAPEPRELRWILAPAVTAAEPVPVGTTGMAGSGVACVARPAAAGREAGP
jgi:hypothetical protein